jgi:glycosyltransferase involved in cell wall biosynthesis
MKLKKILFVLPTLSAGGSENYTFRFIKHNLKEFDFHVLSLNSERGDLYIQFENLNIPIYHQSLGYFNLKKMKSFYSLLKENNYDTICTFNGNFGGISLTIAKYAGVKNRLAFYRRSTNAFGNNVLKLLYNTFVSGLVRKNANIILSNSEAAFKNFHSDIYQKNKKYKVIRNGVSANDFNIARSKEEAREALGLDQNIFIIGHVGRYDPAKNHETIFKVIQKFKEDNDNVKVKFVFCGKGTDSEQFLNQLKVKGIEDIVVALGLRNDLPLVYKALDVFYFPSITEGQPNALIEAMISGLPVVTSNIPPILEALPEAASVSTLDPKNVNAAFKILKCFYNNDIDEILYQHQKWAILNFDPILRFNEFKNILSK